MTPAASFEIEITSEGSSPIMTSRTGVVSGGEVFQSARRADLSFLWQAGRVVMTISATQTLSPAVLRMTESETKRSGIG